MPGDPNSAILTSPENRPVREMKTRTLPGCMDWREDLKGLFSRYEDFSLIN